MRRSSRSPGARAGELDTVYSVSGRIGVGEDDHGIMTLSDPQDRRIQRFFRRLGVRIPPARRLTLDEYGSFVVRQLDGGVSVEEVGRRLKKEYGPRAEPVFDRLVPYLGTLERARFIVTSVRRGNGRIEQVAGG